MMCLIDADWTLSGQSLRDSSSATMNRQQLFNYSIRAATSSVRLRLANWSSAIRSRLFTSLGLLQLATLCALVILIMLSILVLRHASDDYFVPLVEHLQSLKIAFPPIVAFFATYLIAFVGGIALADAPKTILSFLRNKFFQSKKMMTQFLVMTALMSACAMYFISYTTPPSYEHMASLILSGSSDNLQLAREKIDQIKKINPQLSSQFAKVTEVFSERNSINSGSKSL